MEKSLQLNSTLQQFYTIVINIVFRFWFFVNWNSGKISQNLIFCDFLLWFSCYAYVSYVLEEKLFLFKIILKCFLCI